MPRILSRSSKQSSPVHFRRTTCTWSCASRTTPPNGSSSTGSSTTTNPATRTKPCGRSSWRGAHDGENSVDGELDAAAKWGDASAHRFEGDATVTRRGAAASAAPPRSWLYAAATGSRRRRRRRIGGARPPRPRGGLRRDRVVRMDRRPLRPGHRRVLRGHVVRARAPTPRRAAAAVDETHVADDVELKVVVTEDRRRRDVLRGHDGQRRGRRRRQRLDGPGGPRRRRVEGRRAAAAASRASTAGGDAHDIVASLGSRATASRNSPSPRRWTARPKTRRTLAGDRRYGAPPRPAGDDAFAAELKGDLAWKRPKEPRCRGARAEAEEWTYSPWGNDYQGSKGAEGERATTSDQQDELDVCEIDDCGGGLAGMGTSARLEYGYMYGSALVRDGLVVVRLLRRHDRGRQVLGLGPAVDGEYADYGPTPSRPR